MSAEVLKIQILDEELIISKVDFQEKVVFKWIKAIKVKAKNIRFFFSISGVTKRIKIYNYNTVLKDTVDIHYPSIEMVCGSKISCVAWSAFHQSTLASSDYDHTVIVWDAATATKV